MTEQTEAALPEAFWRDAPERVSLINELHARPFLPLRGPARVFFIAVRPDADAAPSALTDHLSTLLAHFGVDAPPPGANHLIRELPGGRIKWERHTEFASYSLVQEGPVAHLFDLAAMVRALPRGWLAAAPGAVVAAVMIEIDAPMTTEDAEGAMRTRLDPIFAPAESLAAAWTAGAQALAMGDFRLDPQGATRFAVIPTPEIGPRRLGRITQRLIELETYRALAMTTLPIARDVGRRITDMDRALTELIADIAAHDEDDGDRDAKRLRALTKLSAEIESLSAETAFRFGATRAYASLVEERMKAIREKPALERQTFEEFMARRFRPAIRTCNSTAERLEALSRRAERAATLLRTRVDVALEAQNQQVLRSMDERAELQLRLQETVEGLSVVAISYYAVSLAGYVLAPVAMAIGADPKTLQGAIALPVVAVVWWFVRRIRRRVNGRKHGG